MVVHEYVHGVTSRLIGSRGDWKPLLNGPPQARAMDEGTSDYFALTIQNHLRLAQQLPESLVYGAWSSANSATGRRPFSYDGFQRSFSQLANPPFRNSAHAAGMIWCASLLEMQRQLSGLLGRAVGDIVGWLLVMGALRLVPVGPKAPASSTAATRSCAPFRQCSPSGPRRPRGARSSFRRTCPGSKLR